MKGADSESHTDALEAREMLAVLTAVTVLKTRSQVHKIDLTVKLTAYSLVCVTYFKKGCFKMR